MGSKRQRLEVDDEEKVKKPKKQRARKTTLFDAVAGRAGYESLLPQVDRTTKYRDTRTSSRQSIPPEEVLFRRKNAPVRYQENDIYFANEKLRPDQKLPNSDLLKYIHSYASKFYKSAGGKRDWKSMDETALLAVGILLEEAAVEHLDQSGDFAFLEARSEDSLVGRRKYWDGERWAPSVVRKNPNNRTDHS